MSNAPNGLAVKSSVKLRNQDIPVELREIEQKRLQFYVDNPRIYSLIRPDEYVPDQDSICQELQKLEHVRELQADIAANGGLIDPLIVRDGDFVVLEGNSRLAAYRHLFSKNPVKWNTVRCMLLPKDIDEKLVFALLGQYHVKGKKDWAPYERAGFLYRRYKQHELELSSVAGELSISTNEARHLVAVYEFMIEHKDQDRDHWSYYDEYLKSTKIKKARDEYPIMDKFVVKEVKSKAIPTAIDLRDKLPVICTGPSKTFKRFLEGETSFESAYETAVDAGGENPGLAKLKRFRSWLALNDTEDDLLDCNKQVRDKIHFELKEVEKRAQKLRKRLEERKSEIA
jgi:hypothetical protein